MVAAAAPPGVPRGPSSVSFTHSSYASASSPSHVDAAEEAGPDDTPPPPHDDDDDEEEEGALVVTCGLTRLTRMGPPGLWPRRRYGYAAAEDEEPSAPSVALPLLLLLLADLRPPRGRKSGSVCTQQTKDSDKCVKKRVMRNDKKRRHK